MRVVDLPAARHVMTAAYKAWPDNGIDDYEVARKEGLAWEIAEMYWVTAEMARVALDASLDMPDYTLSQIIPTEAGLLFYDGGLPELPIVAAESKPTTFGSARLPELPVDYMLWFRRAGVLNVQYGCTMTRALAAGFEPQHRTLPLIGAGTVTFGEMDASISSNEPYTGDDQVTIVKLSIINMLAATWTLMRQETVSSSQRKFRQPSSNQYKKGQRPGMVTTVSLRRMRTVSEEIDSESGRKLTHRHIVRGHWRQQACGPHLSERKPVWIPSYIKGPEGAELIRSEKVMVWRR